MRALFLTSSQPSKPPHQPQGISLRLALFMDALAGLASEIHVAHLVPEDVAAAHADTAALSREQSEYWGHPVSVSLIPRRVRRESLWNHYVSGVFRADEQPQVYSFAGPEQAAAVATLLEDKPDLVFVHSLLSMSALLRSGQRPPRVFFDLNDVEHRVRLRHALQRPIWPGKLAYAAHVPALLAAERRGAALATRTFVCSALDRDDLSRLGLRRVAVVPNAVAMPANPPGPGPDATLLFLGAYDYPPNAQGAERLITRILPLVRQQVPGARLLVAGKHSEAIPALRNGVPDGVESLGFVPDLGELYARTRVVCCPLQIGGGTRLKLIEGAAHAMPMVSTRVGAEGLDFADGREILLRDDDAAFAQACVELLREEAACRRLGEAARRKALELYDAARIVQLARGLMARDGDAGTGW